MALDEDPVTRFLYPPSTAATLNMAANAAQAARVWHGIDKAFAAKCLAAAERAWKAAEQNPARRESPVIRTRFLKRKASAETACSGLP